MIAELDNKQLAAAPEPEPAVPVKVAASGVPMPDLYANPFELTWRRQCHQWAQSAFGFTDDLSQGYQAAEMYLRNTCQLRYAKRYHNDTPVSVGEARSARNRSRDFAHPTVRHEVDVMSAEWARTQAGVLD